MADYLTTDGGDSVSSREVSVVMRASHEGQGAALKDLKAAFKKFDKNGHGFLSKSEIVAIFTRNFNAEVDAVCTLASPLSGKFRRRRRWTTAPSARRTW